MAHSSLKNPVDTDNPEDATILDDDVTVLAETPSPKIDFIEAKMTHLNIRYKIPYRKGITNNNDFKLHGKLLIARTRSTLRTILPFMRKQANANLLLFIAL
jgi:hypothetical protein